jgi:peptidoglycan biosynthesis protein MviN/MurJ (putative lipid II flippase)
MSNLEDPEDQRMAVLYIVASAVTAAVIFLVIALLGGGKIDWEVEVQNVFPMGVAVLTFGVLYGVLFVAHKRHYANSDDRGMAVLYILATAVTAVIIFLFIILAGGGRIDWGVEIENMIPMGVAVLTFRVLYVILYASEKRRGIIGHKVNQPKEV